MAVDAENSPWVLLNGVCSRAFLQQKWTSMENVCTYFFVDEFKPVYNLVVIFSLPQCNLVKVLDVYSRLMFFLCLILVCNNCIVPIVFNKTCLDCRCCS